MRQWRVRLVELLLLAISTVLTYLACEAAFSLFGLRYLPLRLHEYLPKEVRIFAQSSKIGVVPHSFILLLGDSYAQGRGDWLLDADPNCNSPFSLANVINSLSGRDVVSLGVGGSGSAEGMVGFPTRAYYYSERAWYLRLPTPELAIVYFYEGNDLRNNVSFLKRHVEGGLYGLDRAKAVERLDHALAAYPSNFLPKHEADWQRHFPFFFFMKKLALASLDRSTDATDQQPDADEEESATTKRGPSPPTVVDIDGRPQELPGRLQSPGMELDSADWDPAVLVFERSLAYLSTLLPNTPVIVAYIPSPLSSYRLLSSEISSQKRTGLLPVKRVAANSDQMCQMIRAAALSQGAGFLDIRPVIRAGTAHDILHGPRDFKHLNRKGYEILGKAVAERLASPLEAPPCMALSSVAAQTSAEHALPKGP